LAIARGLAPTHQVLLDGQDRQRPGTHTRQHGTGLHDWRNLFAGDVFAVADSVLAAIGADPRALLTDVTVRPSGPPR
jgi:hypothetical protein